MHRAYKSPSYTLENDLPINRSELARSRCYRCKKSGDIISSLMSSPRQQSPTPTPPHISKLAPAHICLPLWTYAGRGSAVELYINA